MHPKHGINVQEQTGRSYKDVSTCKIKSEKKEYLLDQFQLKDNESQLHTKQRQWWKEYHNLTRSSRKNVWYLLSSVQRLAGNYKLTAEAAMQLLQLPLPPQAPPLLLLLLLSYLLLSL